MVLRGFVCYERAEVAADDDVPARVPPFVEVPLDLFRRS